MKLLRRVICLLSAICVVTCSSVVTEAKLSDYVRITESKKPVKNFSFQVEHPDILVFLTATKNCVCKLEGDFGGWIFMDGTDYTSSAMNNAIGGGYSIQLLKGVSYTLRISGDGTAKITADKKCLKYKVADLWDLGTLANKCYTKAEKRWYKVCEKSIVPYCDKCLIDARHAYDGKEYWTYNKCLNIEWRKASKGDEELYEWLAYYKDVPAYGHGNSWDSGYTWDEAIEMVCKANMELYKRDLKYHNQFCLAE